MYWPVIYVIYDLLLHLVKHKNIRFKFKESKFSKENFSKEKLDL